MPGHSLKIGAIRRKANLVAELSGIFAHGFPAAFEGCWKLACVGQHALTRADRPLAFDDKRDGEMGR
jgi:hypothetical protein